MDQFVSIETSHTLAIPRAERFRARSISLCLFGRHPVLSNGGYSHGSGQNATLTFGCPRSPGLAPRPYGCLFMQCLISIAPEPMLTETNLQVPSDLDNVLCMSRRFSIEVAKDYFNFASAHFLIFASGQREALHGHNYQVSVGIEGELDRAGVLLDFIAFKPLVKQLCDELDHRTLIQSHSPMLGIRKRRTEVEVLYKNQRLVLPRRDVILLPLTNTSTELLAEYIAHRLRRRLQQRFPGVRPRQIDVGVEESLGQRGCFRGTY
jgi:6-pyruvoyltetrahydropterin/6-carboxytetrahydropterin synthase